MSSTAAATGKQSRSASALVAGTASGYHILRIDGYSRSKGTPTGEYLKSIPFTVGGHRWCIRYYPNGNKSESADYISLYLDESAAATKAVKAQYEFRFVRNVAERPLTLEEASSFESHRGWVCSKFVRREVLEKSKHLRDDSFAVRCDIVVVNAFRAEETADADATAPVFISVPPSDLHEYLGARPPPI